MSSIVRWEPLREMMFYRDAFDRIFEDAFGLAVTGYGAGSMPVDMYQTPEDLVVKATLPGVSPDAISITVSGDVLAIRGEVNGEEEKSGALYHIRERRYESCSRSLPLPTSVAADKAKELRTMTHMERSGADRASDLLYSDAQSCR